MDVTCFTEHKTGLLREISTPGRTINWAFIPRPLNETLRFDPKLWPLITEATAAVARLEQIKGILANPAFLLRPLQQREAHRSSRLEGTHATPEELVLFDLSKGGREGASESDAQRASDRREVWNHYEALRQGHNRIVDGKPIDKSMILNLHKVLMTGVRGKDKCPGEFRTKQAYVISQSTSRYIPPPPEYIEETISNLVKFIATSEVVPLVASFAAHYQFEAIHPFENGNGRVGRVLLSLGISRELRLHMPWLYLSEYFEKHRREYNGGMFNISANGEWTEWLEFCLRGVVEQSEFTILRCERLRAIREELLQKHGDAGQRNRGIIDMLFEDFAIFSRTVADRFGVKQETARTDLKKFENAGVLFVIPKTRPKAYACSAILEAVFGDTQQ